MDINILLAGIVGSTAYGMAGPDSDVDKLGIFAHPTERLFDFTKPRGSLTQTQPDVTYHEADKACQLLLGCNPTIMEVLWLDSYTHQTPLGRELVALRAGFLSARRVKDAYLGYATGQFRKFTAGGGRRFAPDIPARRTAKHARHLMRLVDQGYTLLTTGQLQIRLENPQTYLDFGEQIAVHPELAAPFMAASEARFATARAVLPDEPDAQAAQDWVYRVRREFYPEARPALVSS